MDFSTRPSHSPKARIVPGGTTTLVWVSMMFLVADTREPVTIASRKTIFLRVVPMQRCAGDLRFQLNQTDKESDLRSGPLRPQRHVLRLVRKK